MPEDPIVAETRALRQEMMDEAGNDLDTLFEYLRREQENSRELLVRLPPRRPVPVGIEANDESNPRQ